MGLATGMRGTLEACVEEKESGCASALRDRKKQNGE